MNEADLKQKMSALWSMVYDNLFWFAERDQERRDCNAAATDAATVADEVRAEVEKIIADARGRDEISLAVIGSSEKRAIASKLISKAEEYGDEAVRVAYHALRNAAEEIDPGCTEDADMGHR